MGAMARRERLYGHMDIKTKPYSNARHIPRIPAYQVEMTERRGMSWQDEFRQLFPITRDQAYANIAYTSPLAPKVAEAVAAFFEGITYARSDKPRWLRDADALRLRLARLIGGDAKRLAYTKNTTEAEHRCARAGLAGRRQPGGGRSGASHQCLALAESAAPRRAGAGGAGEFASLYGGRPLAARGCAHAADRGVLGAIRHRPAHRYCRVGPALRRTRHLAGRRRDSGRGAAARDVDEWGVDAFACGAHKGMLGPLGVGLLHVSPRLLDAWIRCTSGLRASIRWTSPDCNGRWASPMAPTPAGSNRAT